MNSVQILTFFFVALTYPLVNNVQASLDGERIVGGTGANPGEYTYQVSLRKGSVDFCGGAIIGDRHIVTAAHCVTDEDGVLKTDPIQVIAGVNNLKYKYSLTRVEVDVERVYIPKNYVDSEAWNADEKNEPKQSVGDIAVLLLVRPFDFKSNPNLRKLKLGNPESTYTGEAVVTGFGWIYVFNKKNPSGEVEDKTDGFSNGELRFAKTQILSSELCSRLLSDDDEPPPGESHICAKVVQPIEGNPEGVCNGDSGGPLVYESDTLIGVLSTSPTGCEEDVSPAIYTRVSSYIDFIIKAVSNVQDPQILTTQLVDYTKILA